MHSLDFAQTEDENLSVSQGKGVHKFHQGDGGAGEQEAVKTPNCTSKKNSGTPCNYASVKNVHGPLVAKGFQSSVDLDTERLCNCRQEVAKRPQV